MRTLPTQQLADERAQLKERAGEGAAVELMLALYDAETSRRESPELRVDDDLDAAVSRLERLTTPEDRHLVREIGEGLHRIGGVAAVRRTIKRMLAGHAGRRAELRLEILHRRWHGLVGQG